MFIKTQIESKLDAEINSLLDKLSKTDDSTEYTTMLERISKLHKLKTEEKSKPISPDTALVVAANIFGILWLARYERENVVRSQSALRFVMKPR